MQGTGAYAGINLVLFKTLWVLMTYFNYNIMAADVLAMEEARVLATMVSI